MATATPRGKFAAPASYDEMYREYKPLITTIVAKEGIVAQDVDDVSHEILCKILGHDMLADYDPTKEHDTAQGARPARFNTFLASVVKIYCRHYRVRQVKQYHREPAILDQAAGDEDGATLAETRALEYGLAEESDPGHIEGRMVVEDILRSMDDHEQRGTRDLKGALRIAAEQVARDGVIDRAEIAQRLGVGSSTVSNIFADLKEELTVRGYSQRPPRGFRTAL